ncbi:MAG: S8 family serine peptidase [Xanthomonadaceae bacterium]|nr:S8 family serine peptidase [Xanthomonadaceae bacterium]
MRALQRLTIAALLTTALALPGAGPAAGHDRDSHETRDVRETRDSQDARETDRDRDRDTDRDRQDAERGDESKDRSRTARDNDASKDSKDTAVLPTGGSAMSKSSDSDSDSSGSGSGSSSDSSASNTSGSNSGSSSKSGSSNSGSSNSGSSNSGSGSSGSNSGSSGSSGSSDSDVDDDSGSNSGSSNSGSDNDSDDSGSNSGSSSDDDDDDRGDDSGSNSGSSNSGSDDDDQNEDSDSDDDNDDGDDSDGQAQAAGAGDARRIDIETDAQGRERRRGEFLVRGGREVADALRAAGFRTLSSRHLSNLNASVLRVEVRAGSTMDADIAFARHIAGTDDAEPNYVFRLSGAATTFAGLATAAAQTTADSGVRVGVVDTGADGQAPALRDRIAAARGFGGPYTARTHGTYVAQILARENVRVEVADVFQADAQGAPVATAESIARGIDWLAARRIPVVNVSITGPNSGVLSAVVARAIERGTIVVAAAGNDGPAAPPVYPAAFANVVGVTAVDQGGRVYRRANRGQYVDFAALGVRVPVTGANGNVEYVSGTSYAAPLIAAAFARRYTQQRPGGAVAEIARMQNAAIDLGERGRDPVFGWGRVSTSEAQR